MSEKKDQLEEILKDQFNREAKQIAEEVGLNDNEEIPEELKIRMKKALDQKIRERELRSEKKIEDRSVEISEEIGVSAEDVKALKKADTHVTDNMSEINASAKLSGETKEANGVNVSAGVSGEAKESVTYAGLSKEDQEALRLGREMLKNQGEEKKVYAMRRKKRNIRRIVALAAVLILVMAVGMTSLGGPERMLQFVKSSVGGRQVSKVNSSDKNKIIEEEDEEKAYERIAEEFGIEPVKLMWRPDGMEFEKMELDTDMQVAELDYVRNGEKTEFMISASYGEVSWGYENKDEEIEQYMYNQVKKAKIEITEYQTPKTETNRYVAEFEYKKLHYCLAGELNQNEIEKILNNLYFMK